MKKTKELLVISLINPAERIPTRYMEELREHLQKYVKDKDYDILLLPNITAIPMPIEKLEKLLRSLKK